MIQLDKQVYDAAKQLFENKLAALKENDPSFEEEVAEFKLQQASRAHITCADDEAPYCRFTCDGKFSARMQRQRRFIAEWKERKAAEQEGYWLDVIPWLVPKPRYY